MITIATILLAFLFTLISYDRLKSFRNHYVIFNIWWVFLLLWITFISTGLNPLSSYIQLIVFLGLISFNFSLFTTRYKIPNIKVEVSNLLINMKFFIGLQILVLYFLIPYFIKSLFIIQTNTLAHVKAGLTETFSEAPLEVLKIYWFCEPMVIASIIISCFFYFFKKGQNLSLFLTVVNVILFSVAFGGRIQMFRMSFIIILFIFLSPLIAVARKFVKRKTKRILILILGLFVLMTVFTEQRSWDSQVNYLKTFDIYFVGSLSLLDFYLENSGEFNIEKNHLFGRASLASFIDPFILAGSQLGLLDLSTQDMGGNIINSVISKSHKIGVNHELNAFSTMYYPFIRDFGIYGIVIFPFLFGCILNWLLKHLFLTQNILYFIAYIMLCFIMVFGSIRWELVNFWPFGALFFSFLIFKDFDIRAPFGFARRRYL